MFDHAAKLNWEGIVSKRADAPYRSERTEVTENASIMRRAQILRRGRFGESNQARDMATEGWMKLAKG
jgi:hypothetical protein